MSLLAVLDRVTDPRSRRGVRHRLTVVLVVGVCAVLGGMRSFVAIAQWARDSVESCPQLREQLGDHVGAGGVDDPAHTAAGRSAGAGSAAGLVGAATQSTPSMDGG